jgi:hypothetical protein
MKKGLIGTNIRLVLNYIKFSDGGARKGAACPNERHARKDRLGKAAGAGVRLPEQESGAYRVEGEMARRARP